MQKSGDLQIEQNRSHDTKYRDQKGYREDRETT
jgi:hypothetical protein